MSIKVFVYGTLKRGHSNHDWHLARNKATYLGIGSLHGYRMGTYGRAFPFIWKAEPTDHWHRVHGELYEVDAATLEALDRLEGTPNHYQRVEVEICANGGNTKAWTYVQEKPDRECYSVAANTWYGGTTVLHRYNPATNREEYTQPVRSSPIAALPAPVTAFDAAYSQYGNIKRPVPNIEFKNGENTDETEAEAAVREIVPY